MMMPPSTKTNLRQIGQTHTTRSFSQGADPVCVTVKLLVHLDRAKDEHD
jgi:hypothetical protein